MMICMGSVFQFNPVPANGCDYYYIPFILGTHLVYAILSLALIVENYDSKRTW